MRRQTLSFLQLQLGQEVIYLLLAVFSLISLVLGLFLSEEIANSERLAAELAKTRIERDKGKEELRVANARISELYSRMPSGSLAFDLAEARREISRHLQTIRDLNAQLEGSKREVANLRLTIDKLKVDQQALLEGLNDKPPIISLSEAQGYTFASGDSQLSEDFRAKLLLVVIPKLLFEGERHRAKVIEVVGHTDEVHVPERYSSLDSRLLPFLRGEGREGSLLAADNTGLGMTRAAAVARFLIADSRLAGYVIVPLSAGQVIDIDGQLAAGRSERDVRERRRIEIRLRR